VNLSQDRGEIMTPDTPLTSSVFNPSLKATTEVNPMLVGPPGVHRPHELHEIPTKHVTLPWQGSTLVRRELGAESFFDSLLRNSADDSSWCITTQKSEVPPAEEVADKKEKLDTFSQATAVEDSSHHYAIASSEGVRAGTYCCPGKFPTQGQLAEVDCSETKPISLEAGVTAQMKVKGAKRIIHAKMDANSSVSSNSDQAKTVSTQMVQLVEQSDEDTLFLVSADVYHAMKMSKVIDRLRHRRILLEIIMKAGKVFFCIWRPDDGTPASDCNGILGLPGRAR